MSSAAQPLTANQLVAVNMQRLRKAAGLTQEELGTKLGWSKVAVSAAERSVDGRRVRQFRVEDAAAIAAIFGVPIGELVKPPPCGTCDDGPPPGFTCNACGRSGS